MKVYFRVSEVSIIDAYRTDHIAQDGLPLFCLFNMNIFFYVIVWYNLETTRICVISKHYVVLVFCILYYVMACI